jgi:hypothetical protein
MSFTITPHRPAFAGWTAFAGRARGIRWLNGICSTGLRYKDHIGNPMVSAYVQFLYIFSAGLSNWMGWTFEGWFSRLSNSSRLSKCSFYAGVELGRVRPLPPSTHTCANLQKKMHRSCETISLRNGTPSSLLLLTISKYFYGLRTDQKITQMQARRGLWKSLHVSRSPKDVCLRVSVSVCYGVNVLVSLERKVLIENGTKYNNSQSIMKHWSDKCHYIRDSFVRSRRWPSRVW